MGEAGRLGELLSQIVLLGAYDACVQDHFPERIKYLVRAAQQPITLASFLEKLLPSSHMELLHEQGMFTHVGENKEISEDYCVFFNHFSLLTEPCSSENHQQRSACSANGVYSPEAGMGNRLCSR